MFTRIVERIVNECAFIETEFAIAREGNIAVQMMSLAIALGRFAWINVFLLTSNVVPKQ